MIKVCLVGLGRTGTEIAKAILEQTDLRVVAAVSSPGSSKIGKDLGEVIGCAALGIIVESSEHMEEIIFGTRPDVVVDFSNPVAAMSNAKILAKMKVNIVIGTTGFSKIDMRKLFLLTKKYDNGILYAPNITLGVNVLMLLTTMAAKLLSGYDFHVTEIHHKHKKDAPSGTAIKIAEEINRGLMSSGIDVSQMDIPINAVRAGGVVGKHEVMIVGPNDKIEISHESFSRKAFALGAIKGIRFMKDKIGYFEMSDVLELKKIFDEYFEEKIYPGKKTRLNYDANFLISN